MNNKNYLCFLYLLLFLIIVPGCKKNKEIPSLLLETATSGEVNLKDPGPITDVPFNQEIELLFSRPLNTETINTNSIKLSNAGNQVEISFSFQDKNRKVMINSLSKLDHFSKYNLFVSNSVMGENKEKFQGFETEFYTSLDTLPKFEKISDIELLNLIQKQTFKYFWDFGHPSSGMARERDTSGDIVTSGGTGFGLMSLLVGINRGFITRNEGLVRIEKIVDFLVLADRFHGAWPHWMNGTTGETVPFSPKDNGGDLVETAFLVHGLLSVRQFLDPLNTDELEIIDKISENAEPAGTKVLLGLPYGSVY